MAGVFPFHGLRFDPAVVGPLDKVVAPPYDVIADEAVAELRDRSPYNVVRLTRPGADYQAAARQEAEWLGSGALCEEPARALYVHEQQVDGGEPRRGIVAAVRLRPYESGEVLPHERTHRGPKEDRLRLYRATATSFEPLWFVYQGAGSVISDLLVEATATKPTYDFASPEGGRNRLWVVTDPDWAAAVTTAFDPLPLLIADGHHRYETALAYAEEVDGPQDAASRFALVLLVDIGDPGLKVLPTHRVMRLAPVRVTGGEPKPTLEATLAAIRGVMAAGYYAAGEYSVLPLEGALPLVELHRQVIDNLLGKRSAEDVLLYTRDPEEAVRWVDEGRGQAAFFLDAPDLAVVLTAAQAGKTLPQKSTYFHPKPPSGMVFQRLDRATL